MDGPSPTAWLSGPLSLRWHGRREEIARTREVSCDCLVGDNAYSSSAASIDAYFLPYAVISRLGR
jgi:hypothetical protein